jgi:hypothetical protein
VGTTKQETQRWNFLPLWPDPARNLTAAVCRLRPSVVFDWGLYIGSSARIFYECSKAFKLGYEIHSIGLPPGASLALVCPA